MVELKNWAGLKPHPTDEYVHWNERKLAVKMIELREIR